MVEPGVWKHTKTTSVMEFLGCFFVCWFWTIWTSFFVCGALMHAITACPSAQVGIGCGSRDELPDQGASFENQFHKPRISPWKVTCWTQKWRFGSDDFSFSNRWFSGSMLIFQGCSFQWLNIWVSEKASFSANVSWAERFRKIWGGGVLIWCQSCLVLGSTRFFWHLTGFADGLWLEWSNLARFWLL